MEKAKIFYAKHIEPGIVQYADEMLLVQNDTLNRMDPTFAGCPVLLEHVPDEQVDAEGSLPVGFVISSFFNQVDGCHWCQFEIHSAEAERAIASGYRVSNSYRPLEFLCGGEWHNVPYSKELEDGRYVHLALVRNPRYEGTVILTPDEFRQYNEEKKKGLPVQNSKETDRKTTNLERKPMIDDDKDIKERELEPIGRNEAKEEDFETLRRRLRELEDKIEEHNRRFEKEEDRNTERLEKGIRRAKEINREEDRFMRNEDDRRDDRRDGRWDEKHMDDMRDLWIRYWDSMRDGERRHAMRLLRRIRDDEASHGEYEREWSERRRDNAKEDRLMAARINGPEGDFEEGVQIQTRSIRLKRGSELY